MPGKKPKKVGKNTYFVDKNTVDEPTEKYKKRTYLKVGGLAKRGISKILRKK